ncbi:helix-turn-helix domain-containing protein [Granulicatella sp. zg-ZJ]|uniref:helix-turn-helix domain-containing protein n=1 Tax=unclassified Granulicatella TaxID=2630493 RepID=UPI0013BF37BE|nr:MULTISPECIES: helix-turn-helix domain-containing protein [unclassified Granulicatella]MBS4750249.1 helix-turn-helix domain-containing protein [Carnobacteriaceae bacterium zg-ZUI78]NEW62490.1 helix-turn-helix domain-containing protein [Granulicatella sp. zg-ZJ]NEW66538.1 helix-turn-helix domain-containing protein [Granulicatella sp. zg-84]QMI85812.1 helix-turn-helix domain-containing protein [Carnobacteriaceae bacterium zg-84]
MEKDLGSLLKKARVDKGLSQEEVANVLFVTRQTISRWEQNNTLPNIYVLETLSQLYGVGLEELIGYTKEKKLNVMAIIGSVFFNICLFSGIFITIVVLLAALWITIGAFIISPILYMISSMFGPQSFEWYQLVLTIFLCMISLKGIHFCKKVTIQLIVYFNKYIKFNKKIIYK